MIQFDGPAFPSNANVNLGKTFGNQLYTIANMQAVNQAASLGILNILLTRVEDSNFTEEESKYSTEFANFLIEECSNEKINKIIGWENI